MRTFETPYTMLVYKPIYEASRNENGTSAYGTSLDKFMSAGPFHLTDWQPDAKYVFTVNPDYIYADLYSIEGINVSVIPNSTTAAELFLSEKLDYLSITYEQWEMFKDDPRVKEYWGNSLQYMFVNLGNPNQNGLLGNLDFRKALYYGANRVQLADTIGAIPATRIAKKAVLGNPDTGVAFVEMPGSSDYVDDGYTVFNPSLAREYLSKAYESCSLSRGTMEIYYSESSTHSKPATEIMHNQYEEVFDGKLDVTLRLVPSAQQFSLRKWNPENPTAFDANIGSITSLNDSPHYTFQYYTSTYSPPRFCYSNLKYDEIFAKASTSEDYVEVTALCQQLEKILLDDMVVIPLYELPSKALFSQRITLPADKYVTNFGFGYEYSVISK
jgi:ABC-type oligopeptide transport system substrate-binding subunit